jgi:large subunit ribosomal protein L20
MPRVKRGFKARHRRNKVLKAAKGFRGGHSKLFTVAVVTLDRARRYAYRDRKNRKRDFRRLWITRINAAARENRLSYSKLISGLSREGVYLDRKVLAEMAVKDPVAFAKIAEMAR